MSNLEMAVVRVPVVRDLGGVVCCENEAHVCCSQLKFSGWEGEIVHCALGHRISEQAHNRIIPADTCAITEYLDSLEEAHGKE